MSPVPGEIHLRVHLGEPLSTLFRAYANGRELSFPAVVRRALWALLRAEFRGPVEEELRRRKLEALRRAALPALKLDQYGAAVVDRSPRP
jgi:hypothetical protein